jgi:putative transposase
MIKNRKLSLAISDCGWGKFRQMLTYKAADLRVIGRFEPSSQICSICGDRNKELKLSQRTWICRNGHELDRDFNAAVNIRNFGLRASTYNAKVEQ